MSTLREDLAKLRQLKVEATAANKAAEKVKRERDEWQRHCLDRMDAEGFTGKVEFDGTPYTPHRDKHYASIQDKAVFLEWAEENAPHLVSHEPKKGDLNTLVRNALDDGEELPPGIGWYDKDYIAIGGLRGESDE
jgi:hypothetical protein